MKNCFAVIEEYRTNPNPELLQEVYSRKNVAYSKIDKAVKKGVLHRNNGARKKSQLAKALKSVGETTAAAS